MKEVPSLPDVQQHPEELRRESLRSIRRLQARSCRGLWALSLFFAVSIAAFDDFEFLPGLPPGLQTFLGFAPSPHWISLALLVYTLSAVLLTAGWIVRRRGSLDCFSHVGYLTAIFGFYHFAGALRGNFWAVFSAGVIILGLSAYAVWADAVAKVRREKERAGRARCTPP